MVRKTTYPGQSLFKAAAFWISIMLSLIVLALYVLSRPEIALIPSIALLEIIEATTLDLRFRLRGPRQPGDNIVIMAVDEKTEDALGRWQSAGRRWIAQMLEILHTGGAKVIDFDLTLAEPDQGTIAETVGIISSRYRELHQADMTVRADMLAYLDDIRKRHDYDRQLADAIHKAGNVVLGMYLFFDQSSAAHLDDEELEACDRLIERTNILRSNFPLMVSATGHSTCLMPSVLSRISHFSQKLPGVLGILPCFRLWRK